MNHLTPFEVVLTIVSAISYVYGFYKFITLILVKHERKN